MELTINSQNFETEVSKSDKPVLIDFWAAWCGPCRMLAPVIERIAKEHPEIKVCKVNVDEEPELAASFNVASIPYVAVIKDGKVVNKSVGYRSMEEILALV